MAVASVVGCNTDGLEEAESNASAVVTQHILVIKAVGQSPAPTAGGSPRGASGGQTDDVVDPLHTERRTTEGAVLRSSRVASDLGKCILPNGSYKLSWVPTHTDGFDFVTFATEQRGVGGQACGISGWVDTRDAHYETTTTPDRVEAPTASVSSCGSNSSFEPHFIKPVHGPVTGNFGDCRDSCSRRHAGIDIAASTGTPVLAAEDGRVIDVGYNRGACGSVVWVRHPDGSSTRFCHNSKILVETGDCVKKGQVIAKVGNTGIGSGPHMHLEFYPEPNSSAINPRSTFDY